MVYLGEKSKAQSFPLVTLAEMSNAIFLPAGGIKMKCVSVWITYSSIYQQERF